MAGEVLNMSILTTNKLRFKLKNLCSKNRHKTIYSPLCESGAVNLTERPVLGHFKKKSS